MAKTVGSEGKASEKDSNLRSGWMVTEGTKQHSHGHTGTERCGGQSSQASVLASECGFNRPKFCQRTPASFLGYPLLTRQLMNQLKTQSMSAYFKVK